MVMSRLDRLGKGMLLFHDTHQWTADMVPMLLQRTEGEGLQDRSHGSRPRERPDRPCSEGLVLGDGAGDRRLETALRKIRGPIRRRAVPGEAGADGVTERRWAGEEKGQAVGWNCSSE